MARMYSSRKVTIIFLILAVISPNRNTNRKYVRSEAVGRNLLPEVGKEDLCKLGSVLADKNRLAVEDVKVVPVERVAAGMFPDKKPRAVIHGLERSLLGSGAHRQLHSLIDLELDVDNSELSIEENCELVVLEHLSREVFADPFQLHRLQQTHNDVRKVHIYGDVDLERPAKNSFQSIVEIRLRLVSGKEDASKSLFRSEVTLPLHSRYPLTSVESYFLLNISVPHILVYCQGDNVTGASSDLRKDLCIYALWRDTAVEIPFQTLQWWIPSGYPAHSDWVARLTTFASLAGVVVIFRASRLSGLTHDSRSRRS